MLLVSARCQTITDWFIVIVSMIVIVAIIVIIVIFVCSRRAGLPRQPSAPRPSPTAKTGPWQRFLQAKRKGTKCTMKEIADQWGSLSAEQKRMWQQPAAPPPGPVPVPVRPAAQANSGHSVWPKCGDDFYPIRSAVLQDLPAQVGALSHEWRTHVSDEVLGASRSLDAGDVKHLCETEYGAGRCASTLTDADKTALAKARVTLRQWCNLRRPKPCKVDGVWESPSLLYVGPREAPPASADALPPGYLVLQLYAELSPLVLVACVQRSMPPTPGDVVQLRLSVETLLSDAELARTGHVCSDCVASTTSVPLAFLIAQWSRFWIQGHVFLMVRSAPLRLYLSRRLLCVL